MRSDYHERRANRINSLRAAADKAQKQGDARVDSAMKTAGGMPLGQPILVGHHSERRDRRLRDRIQSGFEKGQELREKAKDLRMAAAAAERNTAISSDNPDALSLLVGKLARAQFRARALEIANDMARRGSPDPVKLKQLGLTAGEVRQVTIGDSMGRKGIPAHVTARQANLVRHLERRIEQVKAEEARPTTERTLNGVRIVDNREDNRIQIHLSARADDKLEEKLRGRGFRFSPTVNAWQRHRTDAARSAANDIAESLGPERAHAQPEKKPWGWVEYRDRMILAGKENGAWRELFDGWILERDDADHARELFAEMFQENRERYPGVTETKFVTMEEYARLRLLTAEVAKPVTGHREVMVVAGLKNGLWHELEKCAYATNIDKYSRYSFLTPEQTAAKEAAYKKETTDHLQTWVKETQWWIDREGFTKVQVIEEAKVIELQREAANRVEVSFEMNGRAYLTDRSTLEVLETIVPPAKASNDMSAVMAVMELGQLGGRIHDMGPAPKPKGPRP